jgi:hypothetical protein
VDDEIPKARLQEGPESAPRGIGCAQDLFFKQMGEEGLGEILRIFVGFLESDADKLIDGSPVPLEKLSHLFPLPGGVCGLQSARGR